jgi:chemotaxis-related protein WspD
MSRSGDLRGARCWQEVGISGDFSCEKLKEIVHCRNCAEYNKAGRQLFDREIPEGFLEEWTKSLTGTKREDTEETVSVTVFRVGNEWLALKTVYMQEAATVRTIHHVPLRSNKVFKGIANVNGELLLCMSVADLLEYDEGGKGGTTEERACERMLVVRIEGERYVFPVDEVLGIFRVSWGGLYEPPATMSKSPTSLLRGIFDYEEKRIGLVDEERFRKALKRSVLA